MVDVQIRKGAGKEAKLRRAGHLTMDDRNGLQKNGKDCRFSDNRELRSELALPMKHHELMLKKCGTYRNNREGNVPTWTGHLTHQDRRRSFCWRLKCVGSGNSRPSLLLIRCCGARRAAMGIRCSYCPVLLRVTFRLDRSERT